jgi:hypothetical protein
VQRGRRRWAIGQPLIAARQLLPHTFRNLQFDRHDKQQRVKEDGGDQRQFQTAAQLQVAHAAHAVHGAADRQGREDQPRACIGIPARVVESQIGGQHPHQEGAEQA